MVVVSHLFSFWGNILGAGVTHLSHTGPFLGLSISRQPLFIPLVVIKKDQSREQYDRSKIQDGVMRACYKRPISVEQIEKVIDEIETEIFNKEDREIPSTEIGEIVMDKLKDLDAVTYVRFASVYREFKDVNTFMDELKKILK